MVGVKPSQQLLDGLSLCGCLHAAQRIHAAGQPPAPGRDRRRDGRDGARAAAAPLPGAGRDAARRHGAVHQAPGAERRSARGRACADRLRLLAMPAPSASSPSAAASSAAARWTRSSTKCAAWSHQGVREVTLLGPDRRPLRLRLARRTGQQPDGERIPGHATARDESAPGFDLADLLRAVHAIDGLWRIRFLTSHPNYMTDRILETVRDLPKVCEHIEVPIQAGDDDVLESMRRGYTNAEYRALIDRIRDHHPRRGHQHRHHRRLLRRDDAAVRAHRASCVRDLQVRQGPPGALQPAPRHRQRAAHGRRCARRRRRCAATRRWRTCRKQISADNNAQLLGRDRSRCWSKTSTRASGAGATAEQAGLHRERSALARPPGGGAE